MSTFPLITDVVIVGAGPTGLTLACILAKERVPFILLDRMGDVVKTSRAAAVHARTLEVLEQLNVTDRLRGEGHVLKVRIRGTDGGDWLDRSIRYSVSAAASGRPGHGALVSKLSEALFIETLRRYMDELPSS